MDILLDIYQQRGINEAKADAESASRKAQSVEDKLDALSRRCDRLALACQAMWEILRERSGMADAEIEQKILEVDLRDGRVDGRISRSVVRCDSCGRNSNSTRPGCIYCGAPLAKTNVFEV
jgi:hypothetical protein